MKDYDIHISGSLVCVRYKNDTVNRQTNGLVAKQPRLFVLVYSDEHDRWSADEISWGVGRELARYDLSVIEVLMSQVRSEEETRAAKARKDQQRKEIVEAAVAAAI